MALRNNFRVTKKSLIAKFDCTCFHFQNLFQKHVFIFKIHLSFHSQNVGGFFRRVFSFSKCVFFWKVFSFSNCEMFHEVFFPFSKKRNCKQNFVNKNLYSHCKQIYWWGCKKNKEIYKKLLNLFQLSRIYNSLQYGNLY